MDFSERMAAVDAAAVAHLGGVTAEYQPKIGQVVEVRGILDLAHVSLEAGEAGITSVGPAFFARVDAFPSDPSKEKERPTLTIKGVQYRPKDTRLDGQGGVLFLLHRIG